MDVALNWLAGLAASFTFLLAGLLALEAVIITTTATVNELLAHTFFVIKVERGYIVTARTRVR